MKLFSKLKALSVAALFTFAMPLAMAGENGGGTGNKPAEDDAFYGFWETVDGWTSGALGVGLATTMLLMGGAIGVAKNSPMPALSGIAGAAFLHWGPTIIRNIMVSGGLV